MPLADVRSMFLDLSGRQDLIAEATVTGVYTDASLSVSYVSGGVEDDVLYVKMAQVDAAKFRKNKSVVLRVTTDYDVDVVATVTLVTLNGANSYLKVVLGEDDDNSTVSDLSDCDRVAHTRVLNLEAYINEAQKLLDMLCDGSKTGARYPVDLSASQTLVPLYQCRTISKVFIYDEETRTELELVDIHKLRAVFNEPKASMETGKPGYYAPIWIRSYPRVVDSSDFNQPWALEDLVVSDHEGYNAILILPPTDVATYTLEVWGKFFHEKLIRLGDVSFWTEIHPMLLANAAMARLEATYRNTEGTKDWMGTIATDVAEIVKDDIEGENINQMEG